MTTLPFNPARTLQENTQQLQPFLPQGQPIRSMPDLTGTLAQHHGQPDDPRHYPVMRPLLDAYPQLTLKTVLLAGQPGSEFIGASVHIQHSSVLGVITIRQTATTQDMTLTLDNRLVCTHNRRGEQTLTEWTHPVFGLRLNVQPEHFMLDGQIHPVDYQGLRSFTLAQLLSHREGGWQIRETEIGRLYVRGEEALWKGRPLNLKKLRQQLNY